MTNNNHHNKYRINPMPDNTTVQTQKVFLCSDLISDNYMILVLAFPIVGNKSLSAFPYSRNLIPIKRNSII